MSTGYQSLPVAGYTPQPGERVSIVNENKYIEERLLRRLDELRDRGGDTDQRWLAVARTHLEQGFMALNRAIFRPIRVSLPEDEVSSS